VALGKRPITLLQALLERPGALVSKDALVEAAWSGRAVEDGNLPVQIAALRRVLGGAPGGERWIETLPGRGYRFVGPVVTEIQKDTAEAPPQADAAPDLAPTPHADAERRQITAMSCELVAAARADVMDLEDLHEAAGEFRRSVSETVGRYDGFIAGNLGNTVLVLFGYPAAREHDPEQAVLAGLELCAAIRALRPGTGAPTRCRVGIATGMVIIGDAAIGDDRHHEIIGDTPELAARLQIAAQPDTVAIEAVTRRLIGDLFDCRHLDAIATSSGTESIRCWQVAGESAVKSRFEALRGSALSPLIGREEEIELLLRRWQRAMAGDGQVVLISGEAGIGKSRLAAALEERLNAEPRLCLRYFCSPHHQDSALFPVIEQLGRAAEFARDDMSASKLDKLKALLARAAPPNEDVAFIIDLLSLPAAERHPLPNLSPQRKKEKTFQALLRQLEGLAHRQPLVVVFEDAHWIDPTSRELLDLIVERVRSLPVLLIVTFRPEFQPPWIGQPQVTTLTLNRLDRRDRTALVTQLAGGKAMPDDVVAQIADRTDGVPLFVEELTKNVLESGMLREVADRYVLDRTPLVFAIPTTLHASLIGRLDRLAGARLVAQVGAAIGREFSYGLLHAASDLSEAELRRALVGLVTAELVLQRGSPPEAVYSFKHALVQEAAHGTLLRGARQQLHRRIADALEAQSPELMETHPELFAQHYAEAGLVEKSVMYWGRAGKRSAARSAMTEAGAQLQKALDQLAALPDSPERWRQELELRSALAAVLLAVKGNGAWETGHAYARARELWERLGSPSEFLHIPWGQSRYHIYRGEFDLALRSDENLLRLSGQRNDPAGLVLGHYSSGQSLLLAGRLTLARSHLEQALALYDPISHGSLVHHAGIHPQNNAQSLLAFVLFGLGFPDQAAAQGSAALAAARSLAHPPTLAVSLANSARLHYLTGDDATLNERAKELVAVATERGFQSSAATGMIYRGWLKAKNGDVADGIYLLCSALSTYRAIGAGPTLPVFLALLAKAHEIAGQIEEAITQLDEALQMVERKGDLGDRFYLAELYPYKGQLLQRQGYIEAAEKIYREALSIAADQGARLLELRAATTLTRLYRDQDRYAEARDLLAPVYGWFTEGFDTRDLKEAKVLLEELA
jgi:class 3 adenylate cyclase/tetratricopeptide (TPR) repeat protein